MYRPTTTIGIFEEKTDPVLLKKANRLASLQGVDVKSSIRQVLMDVLPTIVRKKERTCQE